MTSPNNQAQLQSIIRCIDLTSLNSNEIFEDILSLCRMARTPLGDCAAVCVYPQWISHARTALEDSNVRIATVCNFPHGRDSLENTQQSIRQAISLGADEIDVVLPYHLIQNQQYDICRNFLHTVRATALDKTLKLIIESGELTINQVRIATECAIDSRADFVKTSTGKTPTGATPDAVAQILRCLQHHPSIGIKLSGGISTFEQATAYLQQITTAMGETWATPNHCRFGASRLLEHILSVADNQ